MYLFETRCKYVMFVLVVVVVFVYRLALSAIVKPTVSYS